MIFDTTICAPATSGHGAICVLRISGAKAFEIADTIFYPKNNKKISGTAANFVRYGEIRDTEEIIDEVLITKFNAPHSYSGEDSIEITCHASPYIQKRILELLVKNGAMLAGPGEFTQRAFLNGKMDLAQAEAVADLIASENKASHRIALNQMRGGFSKELSGLRQELLHFTSMIELELDFGEEDVEFANRMALEVLVAKMLGIVDRLVTSFRSGNVIKNGVPVAIIGKPNVGKSSLLNILLNEEKAIVSEIPGTTRDSIEDTVRIGDITFRFIDTAGIRETADVIENLGIRRTYQKIQQAAIILLLVDARDAIELIRSSLQAIQKQVKGGDQQIVLVLNKSDMVDKGKIEEIKKKIDLSEGEYIIDISAKKARNIENLNKILIESSRISDLDKDAVVVSNIRHFEALSHAEENLKRVREGIHTGIPSDLIAQDLRQVLYYIGQITGEITTDEILGNIFRNFCIGK